MKKRFTADIPTGYTAEQVNGIIAQFMQAEGFKLKKYKNSPIYKQGIGIMMSPRYIKIDVYPGTVHIEAFLKHRSGKSIFFYGERDFDGLMGLPPTGIQNKHKACVDRLIAAISAPPR